MISSQANECEGSALPNQNIIHADEPKESKWPYLIMATPLLAGIALALFAFITTDSHRPCYCVQAIKASDYALLPDDIRGIKYHFKSMLDKCKDLDQELDHGDGRTAGVIRWINCTGTACGKDWPELFAAAEPFL